MKKITLTLLLLICHLAFSQLPDVKNFVVTANPNTSFEWGDRFDFEFDIKGNYGTNEIRLWIYLGTLNSPPPNGTDFVIYSRWNREGDDVLNYPNYFTKEYWARWFVGDSGDVFGNIEGQSFTLRVRYNGINRFLHYTVPEPDTDSDGVPDSQDNCPNQAGPASNNGCPIGDPDLEIDTANTIIFSNCSTSTCSPQLSMLGTRSHVLNTSSSPLALSDIRVRNVGESDSPQSRIAYYVSVDNKFDDDDIRIGSSRTVNSINDGGFRDISGGSIIASDFPNSVRNNQTFFLLIVVDDNKRVNESNEENNVAPVRLRISLSSGSTSALGPIVTIPLQAKIGPGVFLEQYPMEIFDFTGRKVASKNVSNTAEETETAMSLPSGLYIIKSEKGDRKIFVN